jgi:hypothetical protein
MNPDPSGLAHSLSPIDLPEPSAPLADPLRWTSLVIALAALSLALLNADAIRGWSYQLPPGAASARIVTAAEGWHDRLDRFGLNRPSEVMRGWWQSARDRRFGGQGSSGGSNPRIRQANASSAAG